MFESGLIRFRYGTMPTSGTGRVGVTPGNQIDFVAVAGYDATTVASNAQNVTLTPAAESTAATFGYSALDQLTATGAISGIAYNSDGDQTSITGPSPRGTVDLTFDGRHQATGQTAGGVTTSWVIDGEGRVARQTKAGTLTRYRYVAPGDGPAWEEDAAGTITASMIAGPLGVLATYASGTATFPVANGHGDIIQIRNASGGLVDTYAYDDSGEVTSAAKPARYGYVGQWQKDREEDSGMIRMGARMYDPAVGRFASWDPVDGGDYNAYTYAGANPCNNYDLDGRKVIEGSSLECDALLGKIRRLANAIRRRVTQLGLNRKNLSLSGIQGYVKVIRARRKVLRGLIRSWHTDCGDANSFPQWILKQTVAVQVVVKQNGVPVWRGMV